MGNRHKLVRRLVWPFAHSLYLDIEKLGYSLRFVAKYLLLFPMM